MEMRKADFQGPYGEARSMPYSLVFHCIAEEDLDGNILRGKGFLDLVFWLFDRLNPQLAQQIAGARKRPFTVSPFFAKRWPSEPRGDHDREDHRFKGQRIKAGTPCRFRLTLLEERLYQSMAGLVGTPTLVLSVDGRALRVIHVLSSGQGSDPWPRSQTYQQLCEEASSTCRELRLQFVTPTMFCRHGGALPLPDPQIAFKGFLRSWNWFAFLPLSSDLEKLIDHHIFLKDFRISAANYDTGEGMRPSFTGWCQFVLVGRHHEKHIKEFNLLADYSFYCGTGHHTDRGMGVTRKL